MLKDIFLDKGTRKLSILGRGNSKKKSLAFIFASGLGMLAILAGFLFALPTIVSGLLEDENEVIGIAPLTLFDAEQSSAHMTFSADGTTITSFIVVPDVSPTQITIPAFSPTSVLITTIADNAFQVAGLTEIVFEAGSGLTTIGNNAFRGNPVPSITLPNTVTSIGNDAFRDTGLTSIVLPNSLTNLGIAVFQNAQLTSVTLPTPGGLTTIGDSVFRYNSLTSVVIPEGFTAIGANAFRGNQLTSVTLPSTLTSIGTAAFRYNLLATVAFPNALTNLGMEAFFNNRLESIDMSNTGVTSLLTGTFQNNNTTLTSVVLPAGLQTIPGAAVFTGIANITIQIPASVTSISVNAFGAMASTGGIIELTNHLPGSIANAPWSTFATSDLTIRWGGLDNSSQFIFNHLTGQIAGMKEGTPVGDVMIPAFINVDGIGNVAVTGFSDGAFASLPARTAVRNVTFDPATTMTAIAGVQIFRGSFAPSLVFPDSLVSIGGNAFNGMNALRSVTFGSNLTTIGNNAFAVAGSSPAVGIDTPVVFPPSLQTIGAMAFDAQMNIPSVTFEGSSVTSIGANAFRSTHSDHALTAIHLESMPMNSVAGAPWGADRAAVLWMDGITAPALAIDDSGMWEFRPATGVIRRYLGPTGSTVDLTVPSTLTLLGVDFPITIVGDALNVAAIVPGGSLRSLTISDGITSIPTNFAFGSLGIQYLNLGNTLQSISSNSFRHNQIASVVLPNSLTTIGFQAFDDNQITSIVFSDSMTTIGQRIFSNNNLTSLVIPDNITTIQAGAFANNQLTDVVFPSGLTAITYSEWWWGAFENNQLTSLDLPASLIHIGDNTFRNNNLTGLLTLPGNLNYVGMNAFANNPGVTHLEVHQNRRLPADSVYDFVNGLFLLSPPGVISHLSFGLNIDQNMVVFMDDPHPDTTITVTPNPSNNTVLINITAVMTDGSLIYEITSAAGMPAVSNVTIAVDGSQLSSADMIVTGINGNGTYIFEIEFHPGRRRTYPIEINLFNSVTYVGNGNTGGTVPADNTGYLVGVDATILGPGNMIHADGVFNGWNTAANGSGTAVAAGSTMAMIDGGITLYAQWDIREYTVNYNLACGAATMSPMTGVLWSNTGLIPATDPTCTGFDFAGWNVTAGGAAQQALSTHSYSDLATNRDTMSITLTAQWTPLSWTVTFATNGGTLVSGDLVQTVYTGDDATPPTVSRTGFDFNGWSGTYTNVTGNVTITAQWTPLPWTVTFAVNGGTLVSGNLVQTVYAGDDATPPTVSRTGFDFNGWSGTYTNITGNVTITAQWTPLPWTVTFATNGGTLVSGNLTQTVYAGDDATPPTVSRTGFDFNGWSGTYTNIIGDVTVTAQWTPLPWTVTFAVNGGTLVSGDLVQTVYAGDDAVPPVLERTGFDFNGWSGTYTNITGNVTVTAQWTALPWTVTFDLAGGALVSGDLVQTIYAGNNAIPPVVERAGHGFIGWIGTYTYITGDVTVTAEWSAIPVSVTFMSNDGTNHVEIVNLYHGQTIDVLPDFVREGYGFVGWNTEPDGTGYVLDEYMVIEDDIVVYAQWMWLPLPPDTGWLRFELGATTLGWIGTAIAAAILSVGGAVVAKRRSC